MYDPGSPPFFIENSPATPCSYAKNIFQTIDAEIFKIFNNNQPPSKQTSFIDLAIFEK